MRLVVETTGDFQVLHAEQRELARAQGYSVVEKAQFWHERISIGQVIVKGQVNDEATDAEWLETVRESDGNLDLALASFLDRYPVDEASAKKPEPAAVVPSTVQRPVNDKKGQVTNTQGGAAPAKK